MNIEEVVKEGKQCKEGHGYQAEHEELNRIFKRESQKSVESIPNTDL
jgi:hypothetical protein